MNKLERKNQINKRSKRWRDLLKFSMIPRSKTVLSSRMQRNLWRTRMKSKINKDSKKKAVAESKLSGNLDRKNRTQLLGGHRLLILKKLVKRD